MKTLYESLLSDIEDTIAIGDKYNNDIFGELKELQHIVSRVKYWERTIKKIRYIRLGTDELPWKDFGEAYEDGEKNSIIKCMKNVKTYTEIDLLI